MAVQFAIPRTLLQLGRITASPWAGFIPLFLGFAIFGNYLWNQYKLHKFYKRQKIDGPSYRPVIGNLLDIATLHRQFAKNKRQSTHPADVVARSLPHLSHWSKLYEVHRVHIDDLVHPNLPALYGVENKAEGSYADFLATKSAAFINFLQAFVLHLRSVTSLMSIHQSIADIDDGSVFRYMEGAKVILCIMDMDMIRELLVSKPECYRRSPTGVFWCRFLDGLLVRSDQDPAKVSQSMTHCHSHGWSALRRILGPGTDHDTRSVQGHLQNTLDQCNSLMSGWKAFLNNTCDGGNGQVEVDGVHDIAKTSFRIVITNLIGSTLSSNNLRKIDSILDALKDEFQATGGVLSDQFCSERLSEHGWFNRLLTETVRFRFKTMEKRDAQDPGDLLDLMICAYRGEGNKNVASLVEECKMMISAQKSTTFLINHALLLLARHTNWQLQARAEVLDIRPLTSAIVVDEEGENYTAYPKLSKLKILNMILNEVLRLSPPIMSIEKLCQKRHRLGKYTVLPGTFVQLPIVVLHHNQELWGEDSLSFRPDRFAHGGARGRRMPFALLPFSAGPSGCLGFNFALQEAKIVLAAILSNFTFRLSPSYYQQSSTDFLFRPEGAPIPLLAIKKVDDFAQVDDLGGLSRTRSSTF